MDIKKYSIIVTYDFIDDDLRLDFEEFLEKKGFEEQDTQFTFAMPYSHANAKKYQTHHKDIVAYYKSHKSKIEAIDYFYLKEEEYDFYMQLLKIR